MNLFPTTVSPPAMLGLQLALLTRKPSRVCLVSLSAVLPLEAEGGGQLLLRIQLSLKTEEDSWHYIFSLASPLSCCGRALSVHKSHLIESPKFLSKLTLFEVFLNSITGLFFCADS